MLHVVFDRPNQEMKIFEPDGSQWTIFASGDAWGDGVSGPYGHNYPIAPGHYIFTGQVDHFNPPSTSEGAAQVYVADLSDVAIDALLANGRAKREGADLEIGGVLASIGGLARWNRSEIMAHAGGSNAPDPQAQHQLICKTYGCSRLYNADLPRLVDVVSKYRYAHTLVFTCIGDPKPVAQ